VGFLDEFSAGVPMVGSPGIQRSFAVSYEATTWVLFLVPALLALVAEPLIYLRADRWPRKWLITGSLFASAATMWLAACAPSIYALTAAISLSYVAAGVTTSMAEATLVDTSTGNTERAMTRWTLLGWIGDLAGPALLALLAWAAIGWRGAYVVVGMVQALWGLAMSRGHFPEPTRSEDDDSPGLRASLTTAIRAPGLVVWLLAVTLCDLLDEILVVLAALHMRDLGIGAVERSVVLGAFVIGGIVGLVATERLLTSVRPLRVLVVASAACAALYLAWAVAPPTWLSMLLMAGVGATAAPLFPITSAQAYATLPGRSGAVQAVSHLFTPIAMTLPWFLGWLADHAGTGTALLALVVQPLGIALVAAVMSARRTPS